MNRRGFFGLLTAAIGWMLGVKVEKPTAPSPKPWPRNPYYPTQELIDDCGGFIVPTEFEPFIADTKPLYGQIHRPIGEGLTIEEVCRLRGIKV
jgi:hypothetical protein